STVGMPAIWSVNRVIRERCGKAHPRRRLTTTLGLLVPSQPLNSPRSNSNWPRPPGRGSLRHTATHTEQPSTDAHASIYIRQGVCRLGAQMLFLARVFFGVCVCLCVCAPLCVRTLVRVCNR